MTTDDELMAKVAGGDARAFAQLFERHKTAVLGYLTRLLRDRTSAEDASQETWMKVIRYAKTYESRGQFRAWLLTLTRNIAFNMQRDHRADPVIQDDLASFVDESFRADTERVLQSSFEIERIRSCFDKLPTSQRQVAAVWLNEDLSYDEIARQMALSLSSVKSLLFRARQNLEKCLERSA